MSRQHARVRARAHTQFIQYPHYYFAAALGSSDLSEIRGLRAHCHRGTHAIQKLTLPLSKKEIHSQR